MLWTSPRKTPLMLGKNSLDRNDLNTARESLAGDVPRIIAVAVFLGNGCRPWFLMTCSTLSFMAASRPLRRGLFLGPRLVVKARSAPSRLFCTSVSGTAVPSGHARIEFLRYGQGIGASLHGPVVWRPNRPVPVLSGPRRCGAGAFRSP